MVLSDTGRLHATRSLLRFLVAAANFFWPCAQSVCASRMWLLYSKLLKSWSGRGKGSGFHAFTEEPDVAGVYGNPPTSLNWGLSRSHVWEFGLYGAYFMVFFNHNPQPRKRLTVRPRIAPRTQAPVLPSQPSSCRVLQSSLGLRHVGAVLKNPLKDELLGQQFCKGRSQTVLTKMRTFPMAIWGTGLLKKYHMSYSLNSEYPP